MIHGVSINDPQFAHLKMEHSKKLNMEDAIDIVRLCQSHTVDQLKIHHEHMKTIDNHNKLVIGTLEYDLSNRIRSTRYH